MESATPGRVGPPPRVQRDRGDHQRPGAGPAARLVDPGHRGQPGAGQDPLVPGQAAATPRRVARMSLHAHRPSRHHGARRPGRPRASTATAQPALQQRQRYRARRSRPPAAGTGATGRGASWPRAGARLGGGDPGLAEGGRDRQDPPPAGRPDDHECPADHHVLRDRPVARVLRVPAGVPGDAPVVAHDPQPAGRHRDAESLRRRGVARVEVGLLVQGHAVDGHVAAGVAAGHVVARNADHPLDEVRLPRSGPEQAEDRVVERDQGHVVQPDQGVGAGLGRGRDRLPGAVPVEHHDVAGLDRAEVIDELVDQYLVADVERVLHRGRRYEERLDHERLDHQRDHQRDHDQQRQLAPERPALPRLAAPLLRLRPASARSARIRAGEPAASSGPCTARRASRLGPWSGSCLVLVVAAWSQRWLPDRRATPAAACSPLARGLPAGAKPPTERGIRCRGVRAVPAGTSPAIRAMSRPNAPRARGAP